MRWRPAQTVRPLAIGLVIEDGRLLAMRVVDDAGRVKGVRPPGGGIEFFETAEAALRREFVEEFGAAVAPTGPPIVLENLYEHEGMRGHEIVFAFPARWVDGPPPALRDPDAVSTVDEGDGMRIEIVWTPIAALRAGRMTLFPLGLADRLEAWS